MIAVISAVAFFVLWLAGKPSAKEMAMADARIEAVSLARYNESKKEFRDSVMAIGATLKELKGELRGDIKELRREVRDLMKAKIKASDLRKEIRSVLGEGK